MASLVKGGSPRCGKRREATKKAPLQRELAVSNANRLRD